MSASFSFFVLSTLILSLPANHASDGIQQQTNKFMSNGCQYSINNGIISDGNGHSRRMTPEEEQQMANYQAQVARATSEFQHQMAQVVQAPFRGFGISDGITPQLRLPEPPCFHVDNNSSDGQQQQQTVQNASGSVGDEENVSVAEE